MTAVLWVLGGLVYLGAISLMLVVNHGAARGEHPVPDRPSVGADLSEDQVYDEDDEKQHTAWLDDGEAPPVGG